MSTRLAAFGINGAGQGLALAHKREELDAGSAATCERIKAEGSQMCRVTFYYLLAQHFGKLHQLAAKPAR
jgi:hypothetical protein